MNNFTFNKIMVMGAGGVGGFFGGKLAQHSAHEVSFVASGKHLDQIRESGLSVESIEGDFVVKVPVSDDPEKLPLPDLILFSVKSYDTKGAIEQIGPIVKSQTQILPLQNGIENIPRLIDVFGDERVMQSLCRIGVRISEPGKLKHTHPGRIMIGERDGNITERLKAVCSAFAHTRVRCTISKQIDREIWKKFSWNSIFNMVTAAENKTTDELYENGEPAKRLWKLAGEILQVARKEGVDLRKEDLETMIVKTRKTGVLIPSTLHDRRVGKKLEYDAFTGAILRLGKKHGLGLPEYRELHRQLNSI